MNFYSTKSFWNYPCAHTQWKHDGICKLVHGYSRSFHFKFGCKERDKCGFVVDFGDLKEVKSHLDYMFDHTLLLAKDDPDIQFFKDLEDRGRAAIRILPYGVGMEDTAQYLCEYMDGFLRKKTKGRCWVTMVEVRENDKNSGIYYNPNKGFKGWL